MPMTPDELVKTLEAYYSQYSPKCDVVGTALSSAISLIQDYQSLLEKIEVEKLRSANRLTDGQLTPKQAQAIHNYLKEIK